MITQNHVILVAAPHDTRVADAFRRACGVFSRRQWPPFTLVDGDEYDRYRERLRKAYDNGE